MDDSDALSITTYNVLADAYIDVAYYPHTELGVLERACRWPALIARVEALARSCDVLCLQEVEPELYAQLAPAGFGRRFAQKQGRPDGCATFHRSAVLTEVSADTLVYADGEPPTGHVALLSVFEHRVGPGRRLGVANTHLKWEPPDTPPGARRALVQVRQLLGACHDADAWVLCGDFNATPDSALVGEVCAGGYARAHEALALFSCNSNGCAKLLDHLFASAALSGAPAGAVLAIDDVTPLPSADEPSDHLPVGARFSWR